MLADKGKVSIIIPTYNRANTLNRSVKSVLNQTYENIEIIIVDDCSNDNTEQMVKNWKIDKVKYYKLEKNLGACVARNKGIELATGDYIAFQDSDDEWLPEKLQKQIEKLEMTNTLVTFCALNFINIDKSNITKIPSKDVSSITNMAEELLYENFISTQTILGKKEVFKDIIFDEKLPRFQDWDIAIRLAKKYKISYIDEPLVNLYLQKDSITKSNKKGYDALLILYKKYKEDIEKNNNLTYLFKRKTAVILFKLGGNAAKELKDCLKMKFDFKIFIYYLSCITKTNKLLNKLKNRR